MSGVCANGGGAFCCGKGPDACERKGEASIEAPTEAPVTPPAPSGQSDAAAERSALHGAQDGRCCVCGGPWAKGGASFAARGVPVREVCSRACAALPPFAEAAADTVVAEVRADLLRRSEIGQRKYGVTLDRTDLDHGAWLQHAYEEALDLACYLKRSMRDEAARRAALTAAEQERDDAAATEAALSQENTALRDRLAELEPPSDACLAQLRAAAPTASRPPPWRSQ